jgi:sulfite exporter TauE/SafE
MLDRLFPDSLYTFSAAPVTSGDSRLSETVRAAGYATAVILLFFALSASGLLPSFSVDRTSSSAAFFLFGVVAGLSTCAALIGTLVLALTAQWQQNRRNVDSFGDRLRPHLIFNAGRIAAFAFAGGMLGLLGESARISTGFSPMIVIAVSVLMIVLALQMLGFRPFSTLRLALPKQLVARAGSGMKKGALLRPFPTGFLTILLPCGFTMAAEGAAMLSGSPWHGMAIMASFALGTMPPLLAVGLSGAGLSSKPATSRIFMKTAGVLVIFFTIYNLNTQFGIAGRIADRNSPATSAVTASPSGRTRVIRTVSSGGALATRQFELRKGETVRFIVDARDNGAGCMNAMRIPGLWDRTAYLEKGKALVMEFTPVRPGAYPITCAMGMSWGVINVK